ncbi:hypothetical protein Nepgr_020652 [Nepenthes gracilis]|uniref:Uncharacterized protein n=1 Tax=Nepenthes gracilis TaxID=150966 RepID=A0AAD3XWL0_NEPGR|nr:hypothetical protein Nepgr_020652 [Nepenthes gracilis]
MRTLDEQDTIAVFEKLFKLIGNNLKNIVENPSHEGGLPNHWWVGGDSRKDGQNVPVEVGLVLKVEDENLTTSPM